MSKKHETETPFSNWLDADLRSLGLEQQDLVGPLSEGEEVPITPSAITMWKSRGRPPFKRLARLISILGTTSEVAQAAGRGELGEHFEPTEMHLQTVAEARSAIASARSGAAPRPVAPEFSPYATKLAVLFDLLPTDPVKQAMVYTELTAILIRELQPSS